jgi:hypothetical protein
MPNPAPLPPLDLLAQHLEIVPVNKLGEDSGLVWRKPTATMHKPGDRAGALVRHSTYAGRRDWRIRLNYTGYLASRVIYYLHHRVDPGVLTVDHIDRNTLNNNVANLALATWQEQGLNQKRRYDNTSGARGVSWSKASHCWTAQIGVNNTIVKLGSFTCKLEAAAAYNDALAKRLDSRRQGIANDLSIIQCDCPKCS